MTMSTTAVLNRDVAARSNEDKVRAIAANFTDAWNRHDMAAFARLFAEDADFVNVVGMWWKNRSEIEAAHAHSHATFFRQSQLRGEVAAVKFLRADLATVHVTWELTGQFEPDGSVGEPRRGILMLVVGRNDGLWLIHAAQNTDILYGALTRPADKTDK
jgi:uncharacterized protein (TIGR02246 family)